jgi:phage repressor protein C with HTH and peptisase S24 domain
MEEDAPLWKRRLQEVVAARFEGNMKAASLRAGLSETFVRDALVRGRVPTVENLTRLAEASGLPVKAFFSEDFTDGQVRVVGFVGAGAETHLYGEGQGPFDWAPAPPDARPTTVAVRVRGTSMAGLIDDGSLLYYDMRSDPPTVDMNGSLCVIGLADGRVVVKKLYKGGKRGRWNLISTNDAPMLDQQVEWAAKVTSVRMP